jgi:hypothetical protein
MSNGDVVVGGTYSSTMTLGGVTTTSNGATDGFVARLKAADGTAVWVKTIGGTGFDTVNSVEIDKNGDVIAGGAFEGTINLAGTNRVSNGNDDAFVGPDGWRHRA